MGIAHGERRPDVLIAIRTGGAFVAEVMARAVQPRLRILPITCRRPSTRLKQAASWMMDLITLLPRPLLDRLRLLEHRFLTRRPPGAAAAQYRFDELEIAALARWLVTAGEAPFLLVVDDAVDSGVTLRHVIAMLRRHAPPGAVIRSAVIAVTTAQPVITADHALYRGRLCRFPVVVRCLRC